MSAEEPAKDDVDEHEPERTPGFDDNIRNRATWMRLLFMVIMAVLFCLAVTVGTVLVVLQFFWVLFTGETRREFSTVGRQLAEYLRDIVLFMTFNTEERPFPFGRDWPSD
jgi:uncharacterized membrane protein YcjF (UPF0283 family)